uniref:Secreted protein n=1 Tax=Setaria viridis TaxID=4556 RepID=A0A4U6UX94_SETVI|nr:hypothetical protein SEVIR_4G092201v2 [Setaria viridis]
MGSAAWEQSTILPLCLLMQSTTSLQAFDADGPWIYLTQLLEMAGKSATACPAYRYGSPMSAIEGF